MARPSLARRLGAATLLTSLVLTTAACGGDESSTATDDTTQSSEETDSEETDSGDEEASGDLEELSAEEFYPAMLEAMQEAETAAFTTETSGGAAANTISGVMQWSDDDISMQATGTGTQELEMIMLDKVIYMSSPEMPLPEGKKWFKIDLSDPNSLFGQLGRSMDPTVMFEAMAKPRDFELVGTEEVDGVETNHYRVVMATADFVKAMELPAEMTGAMPETIETEMWLDAEDQPRRFLQEVEIPGADGKPTKTTTEGTYTDYGLDVSIEAPPAKDVADNLPGMS